MSVINVDLDELQQKQKIIQKSINECDHQTEKMMKMFMDIGIHWKGEDYDAFYTTVHKNVNEIQIMYEQLSHLSSYLSFSYSQYSNLKSRLCHRAKLLPK